MFDQNQLVFQSSLKKTVIFFLTPTLSYLEKFGWLPAQSYLQNDTIFFIFLSSD
jgi:hypothetical protein